MSKLKTRLLGAISGIFLFQGSVSATSQDLQGLIEAIQSNFDTTTIPVSYSVHKISVRSKNGDFERNKALIQKLFRILDPQNISTFHPLAEVIYYYSKENGRYGTKDNGEKVLNILKDSKVPYATKLYFFKKFPLTSRSAFKDMIFNTSDFLQYPVLDRLDLIKLLPKEIQETAFIESLEKNAIFEIAYIDLKIQASNPHEKQPLQKINRVLKHLIDHEDPIRRCLNTDQIMGFLNEIKSMISGGSTIFGEEIRNAAMTNIALFEEHFQNPTALFGEWGNLWSKKAFHHEVIITDHDGRPLILGRVLQLVFDRLSQIEDNSSYKTAFINALSSHEALKECGNGGFFGLLEFLSTSISTDPSEESFEESHRNHFVCVTLPKLKKDLTTDHFEESDSPIMNILFQYLSQQRRLFSQEDYDEKFNLLAFDLAVRVYMSIYFSNFITNRSLSYAEILGYLGSLEGINIID